MSPMDWATHNADRFKEAFAFMNFSNDDFVRTTEDRHTSRATEYIERLLKSGHIELGDYEGWFDASQEEYVTETVAKEHDFNSPVTGKPLEKRTEQNYFFRLDKPEVTEWLLETIAKGDRGEPGGMRILPEQRKNEVMGRIRQGLQKVPVSRKIKEGDEDWGITMPGDPEHRIYVWIEALCNYLTTMDTPERRVFWPPLDASGGAGSPPLQEEGDSAQIVHLMAKDILWFHAVIWPAMLHALGERPPSVVYAHAYWIAEGTKMSKSLGNFIEIDTLRAYADRYSLDAVRWYLTTQGPLGATDADFAYQRFVEVYKSNLMDGIGNSTSRVAAMIEKYFDGDVPEVSNDVRKLEAECRIFGRDDWADYESLISSIDLHEAMIRGTMLVTHVDAYISDTRPFSIAKQLEEHPELEVKLRQILYDCAETLRVASLLLWPVMPEKMAELWRNWNCDHFKEPNDPDSGFKGPLAALADWGGHYSLKPGQKISKGEPLFMRADAKDPPPGDDG